MASRKTYECFVCKKQGFSVQVYLDGKDDQGRTKYLNEDMTVHTHQGSSSTNSITTPTPSHQGSTTVVTTATKEDRIIATLNMINAKLDRAVALLDKEKKEQ